MSLVQKIKEAAAQAIETIHKMIITPDDIQVNQTKPEFEGAYTVVLFGLVKQLKQSPDALGQALGEYMVHHNKELFTGYNVIKGFLNLNVADHYLTSFLTAQYNLASPAVIKPSNRKVIVEYASPNTNKPLHLGHLRNIFLDGVWQRSFRPMGMKQ